MSWRSDSEARRLYERARASRKHEVRPQVIRLRRGERSQVHLRLVVEAPPDRPRTRGDCLDGPRPCPWVSCRHHLYLDVKPHTGSIKLNRPELEPEELMHSCSLDVAERGDSTMEHIAGMLNMTRERVRQIEDAALAKIATLLDGWKPEDE